MDGNKTVGFNASIIDKMEIGLLPDSAWRRLIELTILYHMHDDMPATDTIAWLLRITPNQLQDDIKTLEDAGLVDSNGTPLDSALNDIVSFSSGHDTPGYVYLFRRPADNATKIGLSRNPNTRLRSICASFPGTRLIHLMKTDNMRQTEKYLHEIYDEYRIDGEWFNLGDSMIKSIMAMEGVEHVS